MTNDRASARVWQSVAWTKRVDALEEILESRGDVFHDDVSHDLGFEKAAHA